MRHRLIRLGGVLALILAVVAPTAATAHPLGNFTVNRFSRLEPAGDAIRIAYVLDMAEIPAFQEQARIDADRDGQMEAHELDAYATARAEEIGRGIATATAWATRTTPTMATFTTGPGRTSTRTTTTVRMNGTGTPPVSPPIATASWSMATAGGRTPTSRRARTVSR